jgi:L-threonylcarbamoyladenylate synthase
LKTNSVKAEKPIRLINPVEPQSDLIQEAVTVINAGGILVFPTYGLYGLGADGNQPAAIRRIFSIKKRPITKPILMLVSERDQVLDLTTGISALAAAVMDRFWPGRVTIVMEAKAGLSPDLTAGSGKIGVRLTAHPVAHALVKALGRPLTGTSANLSGQPGCNKIAKMPQKLISQLDLVLDAGRLQGGPGSTVVDVTADRLRVLREGAVSAEEIKACLKTCEREPLKPEI